MRCAPRSIRSRWLSYACAVGALIFSISGLAQTGDGFSFSPPNLYASEQAEQVAKVLGISGLVSRARSMRANGSCETPATVDELLVRQRVLERTLAASFQVDGVLAELSNEHARLFELSAQLQSRRDRAVNMANIANLVTGTGL